MLRISFISPTVKSNLPTRCCSTFATTGTSPYPFKVSSKNLSFSAATSESPIIMYHRAYSTESAQSFGNFQSPPPPPDAAGKGPARFDSVTISDPIARSLSGLFKYETMSIVQEKVLSLMPTNSDMLVRAKTGTGKTLAFLIAALEKLRMRPDYDAVLRGEKGVSILVMSPTRELAMQIAEESKKLTSYMPLNTVLLVGGESKGQQLSKMRRRFDIVVATPVYFYSLNNRLGPSK